MTYDFAPQFSLLLLANALGGLGIAGISLYRLKLMANVMRRVKIQYVLLFVVSIAAALSPMLFRQWPNGITVMLIWTLLIVLYLDNFQWRGSDGKPHAPESIVTNPSPLAEHAD